MTETNREKLYYYYIICLLFGLFGTMPILQFNTITVFTAIAFGIAVLIFYNSFFIVGKIRIGNFNKIYLLVFISNIISALLGYISGPPGEWKANQFKGIMWMAIYFVIYLYHSADNKLNYTMVFLKGVYYASIVQMVWGYLQFAVFYISGKALNDIIFIDWLEMTDYATQISDGNIKASGLCWNAANMAPLIIFGYVFTKNPYLKLLFGVFSVISGSRTLLLGFVACVLLELFFRFMKKDFFSAKNIVIAFLVIALAALFLFVNKNLFFSIYNKVTNMAMSFTNMHLEASGSTHIRYWTSLFDITSSNSLRENLFGLGTGNSGYAFVRRFGQYTNIGPWVVECDYINQLWSYGYIGAALYYIWIAGYLIKSKKVDVKYFIFIAALLVEGVTYNVIFNWVTITLLFLFIAVDKNVESKYFIGKIQKEKVWNEN